MRLLFLLGGLFISMTVSAYDIRLSPTTPTPAQSDFRAISDDMAGAFSYKPLDAAEAAGITGFHVGATISYTGTENASSWQNLTGQKVEELGFIALSASKGLPMGFDVAAFYADVPESNAGIFGASVKYAFVSGGVATPAVALRAGYTTLTGVDDVDFETKSLDLSVSKGFPLLTPYIGVGQVWTESTPNFAGLSKESFEDTKLFGGVQVSLALLKILLEADATGDTASFNLKAGVGF